MDISKYVDLDKLQAVINFTQKIKVLIQNDNNKDRDKIFSLIEFDLSALDHCNISLKVFKEINSLLFKENIENRSQDQFVGNLIYWINDNFDDKTRLYLNIESLNWTL